MNFSFVIITDGKVDERLDLVIDSIEAQNIQRHGNYEIVIIGNSSVKRKNTKIVEFSDKSGIDEVSRKKNLGTTEAKYENVVHMLDYIMLSEGWYDGFLEFGDDFDVCMNRMVMQNGERFADWCLDAFFDVRLYGEHSHNKLIPYDMVGVKDLSKIMYISGSYWVVKRDFMMRFPLNEKLVRGQGEDVEWSHRIRKETVLKCNLKSTVSLCKDKRRGWNLFSDKTRDTLLDLSGEEIESFSSIADEKFRRVFESYELKV